MKQENLPNLKVLERIKNNAFGINGLITISLFNLKKKHKRFHL